jgi:peptide/nickel transport system permease protein
MGIDVSTVDRSLNKNTQLFGLLKPFFALKKFAIRKPLGFVGFLILVIIAGLALFAPWTAPYAYTDLNLTRTLENPSLDHLLGTDELGRDLLSRCIWGARLSLGISFAVVIIAKSIATVIGLVSGYYGGLLDKLLQRIIDVWIALPSLVLLITIMGVIGASAKSLIVVVGLTNAPRSSRLVRSVVASVAAEPYVEAARSIGANDMRILLLHVLPNVTHIIIYSATVTLGSVILTIASLGFLGYGVPPPAPDLGAMLSGAGLTYLQRMPWMAMWPGLIITLAVFAFNVFGDAVRDVLDPRLRGH